MITSAASNKAQPEYLACFACTTFQAQIRAHGAQRQPIPTRRSLQHSLCFARQSRLNFSALSASQQVSEVSAQYSQTGNSSVLPGTAFAPKHKWHCVYLLSKNEICGDFFFPGLRIFKCRFAQLRTSNTAANALGLSNTTKKDARILFSRATLLIISAPARADHWWILAY